MSQPFKCIVYIFCHSEAGLPKLRFDIVTHVNYAFAIPTRDGHVRPLENPELARAVIARAHEGGAKVCLSLGGWSYEEIPLEATFREATNTPAKISLLTEEIVSMAEDFGFDGVDVDWEYPRTGDGTKEQYEAFIGCLHDRLKPKGMLLTAAVVGGVDAHNEPIRSATEAQDRPSFDKLDWINVMTYDCDSVKHSTYEYAECCVKYWVEDRGFDPEKLNLGPSMAVLSPALTKISWPPIRTPWRRIWWCWTGKRSGTMAGIRCARRWRWQRSAVWAASWSGRSARTVRIMKRACSPFWGRLLMSCNIKVSPAFTKAAESRGRAPGRAPQGAEFPQKPRPKNSSP